MDFRVVYLNKSTNLFQAWPSPEYCGECNAPLNDRDNWQDQKLLAFQRTSQIIDGYQEIFKHFSKPFSNEAYYVPGF